MRTGYALLLLILSGALLGFTPLAAALDSGRVYRVGLLHPASAAISGKNVEAFREELSRLGYREGSNLVLERRYAEGQASRLSALASELKQLKVDVFFAPTEPALMAAKAAGGTTPIVTVTCDPMEKMVGSLARPGGNATGFSCVSAALAGKRLQLLKTMIPDLRRVALMYSAQDAYEPDLVNVENSGKALGLSVIRFPLGSVQEFEPAFTAMKREGCQALYIALSGFTNFHRRDFSQLSLTHRIPALFGFREFAEEGGLISYGANLSDGYRRAAYFVDKILRGANPSDLPAEEPTRFELVVNANTAATLGVAIPNEILFQADAVIR